MTKPLALNAIANVLQTVLSAGLLFALYRYINSTLGVDLLGVWSVVLATASASRLASLGLGSGVIRFVARDQARKEFIRAGEIIDTATLTLTVAVAIALPLLYPLVSNLLPYLFGGEYLLQAQAILPYALVSFWLTIIASVFQGGLDGCHRMDLRAGLMVAGQALLLTSAVWLVPQYGLIGLAWAQIAQGLFLVVAGRILVRYTLPALPYLPTRWRKPLLREMLGYGVNVQIADLFMLLLDPVAKAFMASFGGPAAAGYFEMANQVVLKVRSIIVSANRAIVPYVAAITESAPSQLPYLYRENIRVVVFITLPTFTLAFAWAGGVSWILVGEYTPEFVTLIGLLAIAWGANIFAGPAYFANLGSGYVGWNTIAHVTIGILNALLGWLFGDLYGSNGVVFAYAIALISGSGLLVVVFQKKNGLGWKWSPFREHVGLLLVCIFMILFSLMRPIRLSVVQQSVSPLIVEVALHILLFMIIWIHPMRRHLYQWFLSR